jgi:hypothetical protein
MQLNSVPYVDVLERVAIATRSRTGDRPAAPEVVRALVEAEKAAKHQHLVLPFEAMAGQWRLGFTAGRTARQTGSGISGRGFYIPKAIPAYIGFYPDSNGDDRQTGTITNQVKMAGVTLQFSGVCRYLGRRNIVAFDFLQLELKTFGRSLVQKEVRGGLIKAEDVRSGSIKNLPFFAFFAATEHLIAARGRGGGLAIWIKEDGK